MIGHRGAAACAPENTLAGLRRAAAVGCRWVEYDVRLTADGEAILLHDARLNRTTDGGGVARRLPLATIRRRDAGGWFAAAFAGERVPTLAEALAVCAELRLGINIELKEAGAGAAANGALVGRALTRLWAPDLPAPLISSFQPAALLATRQSAPKFARAMLFRSIPRDWQERAESAGAVAIHADHRHLDAPIAARIRERGYAVLAYTVNEPARARTLLGWGITSVFSDVPHIILAALAGGGLCGTAAGAARPAVLSRQGAVG